VTTPASHQPDRQAIEPATADEIELVAALRRGDEAAFTTLIARYHAQMVRVARGYVGSREVAEEVVQEAWIGVLRGLDRFEGRSSLKTWVFRIVINRAKTRAEREGRSIPFSSVRAGDDEPAVEPERFFGSGHRWAGHWSAPPDSWQAVPEERFLAQETLAHLRAAIAGLPPAQREVIVLRDVEGWTASEVCNTLSISESNQRVLLHRARSKVRRSLEQYVAGA
jgi:RNA polymerase sigma-70 factor (ECF subfamily)